MNRRSFLKRVGCTIAGVLALPQETEAKDKKLTVADVQKVRDELEEWSVNSAGMPGDFCYTTFQDRNFVAGSRRIKWSELGDDHSWPESNFIDLPTQDFIQALGVYRGKLYVLCGNEVWEVFPTGDCLEFCVVQRPYKPEYDYHPNGNLTVEISSRIGFRR